MKQSPTPEELAKSDGFHTMEELYDHRCLLYINLCLSMPEKAAWRADDQTPGWFILYLDLNAGQISYHCANKFLPLIFGVVKEQPEFKWDGHSSEDVLDRLGQSAKALCLNKKP